MSSPKFHSFTSDFQDSVSQNVKTEQNFVSRLTVSQDYLSRGCVSTLSMKLTSNIRFWGPNGRCIVGGGTTEKIKLKSTQSKDTSIYVSFLLYFLLPECTIMNFGKKVKKCEVTIQIN